MILIRLAFLIEQLVISVQLKFDDKTQYDEFISPNNLSSTLDQLRRDFKETTPLETSRLIIDNKIQKVDRNQILLSVTILPPETHDGTQRNTESIMKDLTELIKEKQVNPLSRGKVTRFLDENYEIKPIRMRYICIYHILIVFLIYLLILILLI